MHPQRLVLLRGAPGSGKTWSAVNNFVPKGFKHYEADMYFVHSNGEYKYDRLNVPKAHAWCKAQVRKALEDGHSVVVANTFVRAWEVKDYVTMANELGIPVQIYTMHGTFQNVHGVPQEKVEQMRINMEVIR